MASGKGKLVDSSGMEYTGDWANDTQHGHGVEKWADGSVYDGHYENGKKSGKGKFVWVDGATYDGDFRDNMLEGNGIPYTLLLDRNLRVDRRKKIHGRMEQVEDEWEGSVHGLGRREV